MYGKTWIPDPKDGGHALEGKLLAKCTSQRKVFRLLPVAPIAPSHTLQVQKRYADENQFSWIWECFTNIKP